MCVIKNCYKCGEYKEFSLKGTMCRDCNKAYQRQHYVDNKADYYAKSKAHSKKMILLTRSLKTGPCVDCGNCFPYPAMDFHHINPSTKKGAVSQLALNGWSKSSILEEIGKCILLCSNCHRIRHGSIV